MAEFPGALSSQPITVPPVPGATRGYQAVQRTQEAVEPLATDTFAGNLVFVENNPASAVQGFPGAISDGTLGHDYFERIIVRPMFGIQFQQVTSAQQVPFEITNTHTVNSVVSAVANSTSGAVTIPNLPGLPVTICPMTSLLDPTLSARLAPVRLNAQAVPTAGVASFQGALDFTWSPGGVASLPVSGNVIAFLPIGMSGPIIETLESATEIFPHEDGSEQRQGKRSNPRQSFRGTIQANSTERQILDVLLFDATAKLVALGLFVERMFLEVATVAGTSDTITVDSTVDVDVRIGGDVTLVTTAGAFELLTVKAITPTTIQFESNVVAAFPEGSFVLPTRSSRLAANLRGRRYVRQLKEVEIQAAVHDNDTGVPTGDTSTWPMYRNRVILDDCNLVSGRTERIAVNRRQDEIDNGIGRPYWLSPWAQAKSERTKGWSTETRAELFRIRRLIYALDGRRISWYLPTQHNDLTVTQTIAAAAVTFIIANIGYANYARARSNRVDIRITLTDGSTIENRISGATVLSGTEEQLTVETPWAQTVTVPEIRRVEFIENHRFNSDAIQIIHGNEPGVATISAPTLAVFDP